MALITDGEYFKNLSASGLELAEDYLQQDLEILQENGLPTSDTLAGLITVKILQSEDEEEDLDDL